MKLLPAALLAVAALVACQPQAQQIPADSDQVVTVTVASKEATTGVLEAWERQGEQFVKVHGPTEVFVGSDGVGQAKEGVSRTPQGVFSLTETFGTAENPGALLPYKQVGLSDWWVGDPESDAYNQQRTCEPGADCGFDQSDSEHLAAIPVDKYAIVIDYNRDPVTPGAGSAFFMHLSNDESTGGCVSMPETDVVWLLQWLNPALNPVVDIDVASQPTTPA